MTITKSLAGKIGCGRRWWLSGLFFSHKSKNVIKFVKKYHLTNNL